MARTAPIALAAGTRTDCPSPGSAGRRVAWFIGLWFGGVASVATIGALLRLAIGAASGAG